MSTFKMEAATLTMKSMWADHSVIHLLLTFSYVQEPMWTLPDKIGTTINHPGTSKLPSFFRFSEEAGASDTDMDFSLLVCLGEGDKKAAPAVAACIWALSSCTWSLPPITGFQPFPNSVSFTFSLMLPLTGVNFSFLSSAPAKPPLYLQTPLLPLHFSQFQNSRSNLPRVELSWVQVAMASAGPYPLAA